MNENNNISSKTKNGTTFQTRDEFFKNRFKKPGYEKKGYYRRVVQIDSNDDDELAVVKLLGSGKRNERTLDNYKNGYSVYKEFVETLNHKGEPIKEGKYFLRNKEQYDVSPQDVEQMRINILRKLNKNNRAKIRKLKARKRKDEFPRPFP